MSIFNYFTGSLGWFNVSGKRSSSGDSSSNVEIEISSILKSGNESPFEAVSEKALNADPSRGFGGESKTSSRRIVDARSLIPAELEMQIRRIDEISSDSLKDAEKECNKLFDKIVYLSLKCIICNKKIRQVQDSGLRLKDKTIYCLPFIKELLLLKQEISAQSKVLSDSLKEKSSEVFESDKCKYTNEEIRKAVLKSLNTSKFKKEIKREIDGLRIDIYDFIQRREKVRF